jgi:hypothetical protein
MGGRWWSWALPGARGPQAREPGGVAKRVWGRDGWGHGRRGGGGVSASTAEYCRQRTGSSHRGCEICAGEGARERAARAGEGGDRSGAGTRGCTGSIDSGGYLPNAIRNRVQRLDATKSASILETESSFFPLSSLNLLPHQRKTLNERVINSLRLHGRALVETALRLWAASSPRPTP